MKITEIQQTSSLIRQLRTLVMAVIFFLISGLVGLFISSDHSLKSLAVVNSVNDLATINLQARESLTSSSQALQKIFSMKNLSDTRFLFSSSQKTVEAKLLEGISKSDHYPRVIVNLEKALQSLRNYDKAASALFQKIYTATKRYSPEQLKADLLIASEYELDVREALGKAQIELRSYGDESFQIAYSERHVPLIVATILTILSLIFVILLGVSIYRSFDRSIRNLSSITDVVSHGNLEVIAPILRHDEIGSLTHAFNQMVLSLKENQDQLNQAIQARDEFLSIASHELKTPLTPLKLQLTLLTKHIEKGTLESVPPERLIKMVSTVERQIDRMEHLIEDLLDVAKIRTGKLQLIREHFNLSEMVSEVVASYQQQFEQAQCPLTLKIQTDVNGNLDRLRLEQVFINLLMNAIKYAPGKPVTVKLETEGTWAHLSVQDHGTGIAEEDQKRIFDRFERVKARDNIGGLGLGLYISRQITEAHGGEISVESRAGKGSTFSIRVPLTLA